jgi:GT2 family glycosyltransferase/glycosyltransferase involved in cell wall biosynthesis
MLNGLWQTVRRRLAWILGDDYQNWIEENRPGFAALARQRRWARNADGLPRILLVITTAGCSREEIARTDRSLWKQTYPLWTPIHAESLFSTAPLDEAADSLACSYTGVVKGGDTLSPDALYEFARIVYDRRDDRPAMIYCDEDHLATERRTRSQPIFKPAWSPEMSLGYDYTGRLTLIRRDLMEQMGGFDSGMAEAAEWDLKLRVSSISDRIFRITKCLYHNHGGTDGRPVLRGEAEARLVLKAHLIRLGIEEGDAALQPNGTFRVRWHLRNHPLVSIIVPTVDNPARIERCVRGLLDETVYPNKEIIVVDNGSTDGRTYAFYDQWRSSGPVKLVRLGRPSTGSSARNAGVAAARGEYLLFFDDDLRCESPDWLDELVRWAQRPDVGIVGPKILHPNGAIEHAGVAVTLDSYTSLYQVQADDRWGIFGHVDSYKNVSGLQGECHLMSRSTYARLGTYDERYLQSGADIDICLKACRAGLRNVFTPYAVLSHEQSNSPRKTGEAIDDVDLAARTIIRLAYFEDPFFHPSLSHRGTSATLRTVSEISSSEYFCWLSSSANPGMLSGLELDIYDDASVREVAGRWSPGLHAVHSLHSKVGADSKAAATLVVQLLRSDRWLRTSFPKALSEGPKGIFCQWLCSPEGLTRYGLPATARTTIRQAFEARPGARLRRVYELRPDLQKTYLLAYLPCGRARFFRWLISEGRTQYEFSDRSIWWFLIECAEDPDRELIRTYKVSEWWQRYFPDALTPLGWATFAIWLESRHGIAAQALDYRVHSGLGPLDELRLAHRCRGDWKRRFPKALEDLAALHKLLSWIRDHDRAEDPRIRDWIRRIEADVEFTGFPQTGMNILGMFSYPSGHQESVLCYVRSLNAVGVVTPCRDVLYGGLDRKDPNPSEFLDLELYDTTLVHLQPDLFPRSYEYARLAPRPGTYHIALWAWETEAVPEDWKEIAREADEVWACSDYVADSLRRILEVPVHRIRMGFESGPISTVDLDSYGVPAGSFVFLFIFDMNSTLARKNPLGLMAAFKQAFQRGERVSLILKTSGGTSFPEDFHQVEREAKTVGAIIIDKRLPGDELNGLIAASDCYVSLHRSEGLGLTLAEAMMLGKPTIATGYSGNLDFMDESNSLLVGYHLTEIEATAGPYEKGHRWAEPSISEAAKAMRWVFDHPEEARLLGERARLSAMRSFSPRECGSRMLDRLNQIRSERSQT